MSNSEIHAPTTSFGTEELNITETTMLLRDNSKSKTRYEGTRFISTTTLEDLNRISIRSASTIDQIRDSIHDEKRSKKQVLQIMFGPTLATLVLQILLPLILMIIWRLYDFELEPFPKVNSFDKNIIILTSQREDGGICNPLYPLFWVLTYLFDGFFIVIHIVISTPLCFRTREVLCLQKDKCCFHTTNSLIGLVGNLIYTVAFSLYFSLSYLTQCAKYGSGIIVLVIILFSLSVILIIIGLMIKYFVLIPSLWSHNNVDDPGQ